MSVLPRGSTVRRDAGLYGYERALRRHGIEPIAGVDEAGRGACAGRWWRVPRSCRRARPASSRAGRLQAAHREGAGAVLRARPAAGAGLVGGRDPARRVRPARHARGQRRGAAARGGAAGPAAVVRPDRRVPGRRPGRPRPGGLEGRPGRGLHRGRLGDREGDAGPDDVRPRPRVAGVRLQDAQGLHHRRARPRCSSTARRPCTGCGSSTSEGRGGRAWVPVQNEPVEEQR